MNYYNVYLRGQNLPLQVNKSDAEMLKSYLNAPYKGDKGVEIAGDWIRISQIKAIIAQDEDNGNIWNDLSIEAFNNYRKDVQQTPEKKINVELNGRLKVLWQVIFGDKDIPTEIRKDIKIAGLKFFEENLDRVYISIKILKKYFFTKDIVDTKKWKSFLSGRMIQILIENVMEAEERFVRKLK